MIRSIRTEVPSAVQAIMLKAFILSLFVTISNADSIHKDISATSYTSETRDQDYAARRTEEEEAPWFEVTLSVLLILILSFLQFLSVVNYERTRVTKGNKNILLVVVSFACGLLMSTTFFLVVPEALSFIQSKDSTKEGETSEILSGDYVKFGASLLSGFMFTFVVDLFSTRSFANRRNEDMQIDATCSKAESGDGKATYAECTDEKETFAESENDEEALKKPKKRLFKGASKGFSNLTGSIQGVARWYNYCCIFGDSLQNFIYGIFISASFMTNSTATAVAVVIVTTYLASAQGLINYFDLTQNNSDPMEKAILLNFISALFPMFGGFLLLGTGAQDVSIGAILSFAGGVYLHNAWFKCLSRVNENVETATDRFLSLFFLFLGVLAIGLSMI